MIRDPTAQDVCERCGAWLPVRPDLAEFVEEWQYRFSCLACGWPRERTDPREPSALFPADLPEVRPPGTAAQIETWRLPRTLIVHVNYAAARHARPVAAGALDGLPSLLDHGGRRVARWGSVYQGDAADPHKVRLSLARLRHARLDGHDARAAWLLCERAVLAVNTLYVHAGRLARRVGDDGRPGPVEVAPVLGGGGLSIEGRYRAWMEVHQGFPWLFDPAEKWHDRMRRRFARLPDPEVPTADVPRHLHPLWQFIDVADDLALYATRRRDGTRRAVDAEGVRRRVEVFRDLAARGQLVRRLPYEPLLREPGWVPDSQRGHEADFI